MTLHKWVSRIWFQSIWYWESSYSVLGMLSTPSLPLLPDLLWPGVIEPVKNLQVRSNLWVKYKYYNFFTRKTFNYANKCLLNWIIVVILQYIKLFSCEQVKLFVQVRNTWNHFSDHKQMSYHSFKIVTYKLFVYESHRLNCWNKITYTIPI